MKTNACFSSQGVCVVFLTILFFTFFSINVSYGFSRIEFKVDPGQQFGIFDLDWFEIADNPQGLNAVRFEAEVATGSTVGMVISRANASETLVWGQIGTVDERPIFPAKAGSVWYDNEFGTKKKYIRFRYSKNSESIEPLQIVVNGTVQIDDLLLPDQRSWENFETTDWMEIDLGCPPYYHPLENFDDNVDRLKSFLGPWGGNSGVINGDADNAQLSITEDTDGTRTGFGRVGRIIYDPLVTWTMIPFSLERSWFDNSTSMNLLDLFPDFNMDGFQGRRIDSIAFSYRLVADEPLDLQLQLQDVSERRSTICARAENSGEWERISVAIDDFDGEMDLTEAKFFGVVFANLVCDDQENTGKSGTFFIDDIFMVENNYEKPEFEEDADLLNYINIANFRHFWMAVDQESKFALDRHIWKDLISVDAIGFQLSSYIIGHRNAWIDPALIEERVEHILNYLLNVCRHASTEEEAISDPLGFASVKGNWAHFLDDQTLSRKDANTEYSVFTNALLLAGIVAVEQYFEANENISSMARQLYAMTDWTFLYRQEDGLMSYHWRPEDGFAKFFSDWFSEELDLVFLLGVSAPLPEHRLPANPYCEAGYRRPVCTEGRSYVYSAPGANFTYYFLQMYAKFSKDSPRFQNSVEALLQDVDFSKAEYGDLGYDDRIFGHTACEGPDSAGVAPNGDQISNYHAFGYECKFDTENTPNGTIAVYGTAAPILFIPDESIAALRYYYEELDDEFIETYNYPFFNPILSFPDAFHLNPAASPAQRVNELDFNGPWISTPRFGIDVGPMLMNIDSYLTEELGYYTGNSLREVFSSHPLISPNLPVFEVIVPDNPPLEIQTLASAEVDQLCVGDNLPVSVEPSFDVTDMTFQWFVDDVLQEGEIASNAELTILQEGSHTIVCQSTYTNFCGDQEIIQSNELTVSVSAPPSIEGQPDPPICTGELMEIEVPADISVTWTRPDGSRQTGSAVEVNATGLYGLDLVNAAGCSFATSISIDQLAEAPVVDSIEVQENSERGSFRFSAETNKSPISYLWDFGDGQTSTEEAPTHVYPRGGDFTICLVVGDECGDSESFCIVQSVPNIVVDLEIGEGAGLAGDTISVPIILSNCDRLAYFQMTLELLSPEVGRFVDVESKDLEGVLFEPSNGSVIFVDQSGLGTPIDAESDTLFSVLIELTGDPGDSTVLQFSEDGLPVQVGCIVDDVVSPADVVPEFGSILIWDNFDVFGRVFLGNEAGDGIPDTDVRLEQEETILGETLTGLDGTYRFESQDAGISFNIVPNKDSDPRNCLSAFAVFVGQQFLLGINSPLICTPYQILAADVNCDGIFSARDLFSMQSVIVGKTQDFGECGTWTFVPASFDLGDPRGGDFFNYPRNIQVNRLTSDVEADFVGVKLGNVLGQDCQAFGPEARIDLRNMEKMEIALLPGEQTDENVISIDFRIGDSKGLASMQFGLSFDPTKLEFLEFLPSKTTAFSSFQMGASKESRGALAFSWFDQTGTGVKGGKDVNLFSLKFRLKAPADGRLSDLLRLDDDLLVPMVHYSDYLGQGLVFKHEGVKQSEMTIELFQNVPNPFSGYTEIPFYLPNDMSAELVVTNVVGKVIKRIRGQYSQGTNIIGLATDDWPSGVYQYHLFTSERTLTKTMIISQ